VNYLRLINIMESQRLSWSLLLAPVCIFDGKIGINGQRVAKYTGFTEMLHALFKKSRIYNGLGITGAGLRN